MNKPRYTFADTMQNTSLCFALRASLRLSKFDPVEFLEQKVNTALERVNNLTQSILAKAFKGELTAHWRAANSDLISGENSAEALLKKIRSEREAKATNKKAKKNA